jgi:hypothetical protein
VPVKSRSGRTLTDTDLDGLADVAEAGFDLTTWRPRPGRPSLTAETGQHSPRIAVRLPEALRDKVATRAASEGKSMSQVVRGLLEDYADSPASRLSGAQRSRTPGRARPGRGPRKA